jgi:hypothetical protein
VLYTTDTLRPLASDPATLQSQVSLSAAALGSAFDVMFPPSNQPPPNVAQPFIRNQPFAQRD